LGAWKEWGFLKLVLGAYSANEELATKCWSWRACNLKTMLNVFCRWMLQTLIQLGGWTIGGGGDSTALKNLFLMCFCFWCVLLLCKLWWRELDELVYMMEHNPNCSMKALHELCKSWFYKEIGKKISGERRDEVRRSIFDVGWGGKSGGFFMMKKN
jgi:hypothetical protein